MLKTSKPRKPRVVLTNVQRYEIITLIKAHCRKEGEYAVWDEGWSDQRVADQYNVGLGAVRPLRSEFIGEMNRVSNFPTPTKMALMEGRIAKLELRASVIPAASTLGQSLSAKIDRLEKRSLALEDALQRILNWASKRKLDPLEELQVDQLLKEWT